MHELLSDRLRPKDFDDLVQPMRVVNRLKLMASTGLMMNLLFYGQPGSGKTSTGHLLTAQLDADVLFINGSAKSGSDQVRKDLEIYCVTMSLEGKPKVCFIDECEYLNASTQAGLRGLIEQSRHVRFILTANDISKLQPALKSRCLPICFDPSPQDAVEIISRLIARYRLILPSLRILISDERLSTIVHTNFPDLRRVANSIEFEADALSA